MKICSKSHHSLFQVYYFIAVLFVALLYTYPLVFNLSDSFYGMPWDSLGGIRQFWWQKFSYNLGLPVNIQTYLVYPFGLDLSSSPSAYLFNFTGFILTYLANEVVAYNIIKIAGFPLLALTTYLLLYYLTGSRVISAFIGLVYAFSPFHVIHSMAHFPNLYWVPLTILYLLKLLDKGGYKNGILFGLFFGIISIDNLYYAYFIGLLIPVFILVPCIWDKSRRQNVIKVTFIKVSLVTLMVFIGVIFPMVYPMIKAVFNQSSQSVEAFGLHRAFSDLFVFSAKPLDYLMPSKYNLFLGRLVPDLGFGSLKGHKYTTHTLYLGYTVILLGGYAFYRAVRKAGEFGRNERDRRNVYLFLAVAVIALVLSAPPFIPLGDYSVDLQTREIFADSKLYLPQYFLYKIFPMFRVYARIGAIVLLAVSVLAAFGLKDLLERIKTRKWRIIFLSVLTLLFFVEYVERPPFRITTVKEPEVYKWLASQPGKFPVVEYPLGDGDDPYTTFEYFFYQRLHTKILVNGAMKGTPADDFRKEIIDISKQKTVDKLAGIGVKYVLVHKDKYLSGNETVPLDWVTAVPREKLFPVEYNDGKVPDMTRVKERLRLVKSFKGTDVYEVVKGAR